MSALVTSGLRPTAPIPAWFAPRLRGALAGTVRLLAGLLPQGDETLARDAAVALELKLLGRTAR